MRDRFFREDENELPYLAWEKRDDDSRSQSYEGQDYSSGQAQKTYDDEILNLLAPMDLPVGLEFRLSQKLRSFSDARDCTGLRVEEGLGAYEFIFTRENRYVKTVDHFVFDLKYAGLKRIFLDCDTRHYYDGILNDSRFQAMIGKAGMEFLGCPADMRANIWGAKTSLS